MIRTLQSLLVCIFFYVPFAAASELQEADVTSLEQVVSAFQKLPHYELFCEDKTWGSAEPIKVGAKFEQFLTKEFYRLFLWTECGQPKIPADLVDLEGATTWDIRFGFGYSGVQNEQSVIAENIRVQKARLQGSDKAAVKVLYDFGTLKDNVTTYTVIREDGQWKIDDIAPEGYASEMEELLESSKSIKTDMQNNYRAAEKRYKQEQAKKGTASKP